MFTDFAKSCWFARYSDSPVKNAHNGLEIAFRSLCAFLFGGTLYFVNQPIGNSQNFILGVFEAAENAGGRRICQKLLVRKI